ncbi:MAG: aminoglycoside phosphotransferase family protein [Clostridiales bacterium]|nr:aminoglycoside phosphotransferase family protein [Clostridiales bacterium]
MNNHIVKTTILRDNPGCKVLLEEMQDGRKHVRKSYVHSVNTDGEWNALCFLYSANFNVPKPYKKNAQGMYMQYIDGGVLWDSYQAADAITKQELINKFTTLLHSLHIITPKNTPPFNGFIKNELAEIKNIIKKKKIDRYWEVYNKLTILAAGIKEFSSCYIHRDYHVWNVMLDSNQKLYLIDMELNQGDYRFDVGWTYMIQSRSAVHDARHGDIAEAFLSEYCRLEPEVCNDIEFFMQLANLRWLVNVAPEKNTDNHWFPEMAAIAEQAIAKFLNN